MAKANTDKNETLGEINAGDLSAEALMGGKDADSTAVAIRSNVTVAKQPGRDEYGHIIIDSSKPILIEKNGETIEVSQKAFDVVYAGYGYKVVEAKSKKADKE
jgi:hypothetical protein